MAVYALGEQVPEIHPDAYVHPDAVVIGNVTIGAYSRQKDSSATKVNPGNVVTSKLRDLAMRGLPR